MKRYTCFFTACVFSAMCVSGVAAAEKPAAPPKLQDTPLAGEFVGTFTAADGKTMTGLAKVYYDPRHLKVGGYRAMLYAVKSGLIDGAIIGKKTQCPIKVRLKGLVRNGKAVLEDGKQWKAVVAGDTFSAKSKAGTFSLKRHERKSPTLLAVPPKDAIVLLKYEPNKAPSLAAWANKKWKALADGSMMVNVEADNNHTVRQFKNFRLHAEFMVVESSEGGGGNSGFYLLDRYEVQVLDTFGRNASPSGCAAIYRTLPPMANACLPAGRWQTYDITFHAPVMEGKQVKKHPRITVIHNGVKVHDNAEIPHATGMARSRGDAPKGPIVLQDHDNPVRYRNIWLVELD